MELFLTGKPNPITSIIFQLDGWQCGARSKKFTDAAYRIPIIIPSNHIT